MDRSYKHWWALFKIHEGLRVFVAKVFDGRRHLRKCANRLDRGFPLGILCRERIAIVERHLAHHLAVAQHPALNGHAGANVRFNRFQSVKKIHVFLKNDA